MSEIRSSLYSYLGFNDSNKSTTITKKGVTEFHKPDEGYKAEVDNDRNGEITEQEAWSFFFRSSSTDSGRLELLNELINNHPEKQDKALNSLVSVYHGKPVSEVDFNKNKAAFVKALGSQDVAVRLKSKDIIVAYIKANPQVLNGGKSLMPLLKDVLPKKGSLFTIIHLREIKSIVTGEVSGASKAEQLDQLLGYAMKDLFVVDNDGAIFVTSPSQDNQIVSEAMGYYMKIVTDLSAMTKDAAKLKEYQKIFNGLHKGVQKMKVDNNYLTGWRVYPNKITETSSGDYRGTIDKVTFDKPEDINSATDADIYIAWSMVRAAQLVKNGSWKNTKIPGTNISSSKHYTDEAISMLHKIKTREVVEIINGDIVPSTTKGERNKEAVIENLKFVTDTVGVDIDDVDHNQMKSRYVLTTSEDFSEEGLFGEVTVNPSYLVLAAFKDFADFDVSDKAFWNKVLTDNMELVNSINKGPHSHAKEYSVSINSAGSYSVEPATVHSDYEVNPVFEFPRVYTNIAELALSDKLKYATFYAKNMAHRRYDASYGKTELDLKKYYGMTHVTDPIHAQVLGFDMQPELFTPYKITDAEGVENVDYYSNSLYILNHAATPIPISVEGSYSAEETPDIWEVNSEQTIRPNQARKSVRRLLDMYVADKSDENKAVLFQRLTMLFVTYMKNGFSERGKQLLEAMKANNFEYIAKEVDYFKYDANKAVLNKIDFNQVQLDVLSEKQKEVFLSDYADGFGAHFHIFNPKNVFEYLSNAITGKSEASLTDRVMLSVKVNVKSNEEQLKIEPDNVQLRLTLVTLYYQLKNFDMVAKHSIELLKRASFPEDEVFIKGGIKALEGALSESQHFGDIVDVFDTVLEGKDRLGKPQKDNAIVKLAYVKTLNNLALERESGINEIFEFVFKALEMEKELIAEIKSGKFDHGVFTAKQRGKLKLFDFIESGVEAFYNPRYETLSNELSTELAQNTITSLFMIGKREEALKLMQALPPKSGGVNLGDINKLSELVANKNENIKKEDDEIKFFNKLDTRIESFLKDNDFLANVQTLQNNTNSLRPEGKSAMTIAIIDSIDQVINTKRNFVSMDNNVILELLKYKESLINQAMDEEINGYKEYDTESALVLKLVKTYKDMGDSYLKLFKENFTNKEVAEQYLKKAREYFELTNTTALYMSGDKSVKLDTANAKTLTFIRDELFSWSEKTTEQQDIVRLSLLTQSTFAKFANLMIKEKDNQILEFDEAATEEVDDLIAELKTFKGTNSGSTAIYELETLKMNYKFATDSGYISEILLDVDGIDNPVPVLMEGIYPSFSFSDEAFVGNAAKQRYKAMLEITMSLEGSYYKESSLGLDELIFNMYDEMIDGSGDQIARKIWLKLKKAQFAMVANEKIALREFEEIEALNINTENTQIAAQYLDILRKGNVSKAYLIGKLKGIEEKYENKTVTRKELSMVVPFYNILRYRLKSSEVYQFEDFLNKLK